MKFQAIAACHIGPAKGTPAEAPGFLLSRVDEHCKFSMKGLIDELSCYERYIMEANTRRWNHGSIQ